MDWGFAVGLVISAIAIGVALWALWLSRQFDAHHLMANGKMDDIEITLAKLRTGCDSDDNPRQ